MDWTAKGLLTICSAIFGLGTAYHVDEHGNDEDGTLHMITTFELYK